MSKFRTARRRRHYLVLLDASVATQAFGVIPRVLRKSFDEYARLPIADLGSNRLHGTSLNQQRYSFHETHLSSPKLAARPNLFCGRFFGWS